MATQAQYDALVAKLAKIEQELANPKPKTLTFKVSAKGAISVYGLMVRFPVTLYLGQWERLFAAIDSLKAFIEANRAQLSVKPSANITVPDVQVAPNGANVIA